MSLLTTLLCALAFLVPSQESIPVFVYCLYGSVQVEGPQSFYWDIQRTETATAVDLTKSGDYVVTACPLTNDFLGSLHLKQADHDKLIQEKARFIPPRPTRT